MRPPPILPATGALGWLLTLSAAVVTAIAVLATAFGLAAARLGDRWADEMAGAATLRVSGPSETLDDRLTAALRVLEETPGIARARPLSAEEQAALLGPWLGEGVPLDALPLPRLIAIEHGGEGPDADSLRRRLAGEVPGAVYDDHSRWRAPVREAAGGLQILAAGTVAAALGLMAAVVALAARATLAAHRPILVTLRQIGADDAFLIRRTTRPMVGRALIGALLGAGLAAAALLALPDPSEAGALVTGLAPRGLEWVALPAVPLLAVLAAHAATRIAVRRMLRGIP